MTPYAATAYRSIRAIAALSVVCLMYLAGGTAAHAGTVASGLSPSPGTSTPPLRAVMLYQASWNDPPPMSLLNGSLADTVRVRVVQRRDPWLSFDKLQHFTFSFLFTVGGQYTYVNKFGMSENAAFPLSMGTAWVIGLLKELYDWQLGPRRYFSKRDMVANSVGILAGTFYIVVF